MLQTTARILCSRFRAEVTRIELDLGDGIHTAEHRSSRTVPALLDVDGAPLDAGDATRRGDEEALQGRGEHGYVPFDCCLRVPVRCTGTHAPTVAGTRNRIGAFFGWRAVGTNARARCAGIGYGTITTSTRLPM